MAVLRTASDIPDERISEVLRRALVKHPAGVTAVQIGEAVWNSDSEPREAGRFGSRLYQDARDLRALIAIAQEAES